jgi:Cof subfamily protein (haloacid dehalogenase superfamily)
MSMYLFITDFDGTLLNDKRAVSQKDINALKELGDQGIARCIATGRSIYSFQKALKTFPSEIADNFPVDYLIFSTGAGILDLKTGEIMQSFSLDKPDIAAISEYFEDLKLDYMVHREVPDTHCFVYKSHGKDNPDFFSRIKLYEEYAFPLPEDKKINGFDRSTEVLSILPFGSEYAIPEIIEKIKNDLFKYSVIIATSPLDKKSIWVEVFNKNVSKSKAAAFLADRLGLKKENVFSIGNDYNDMDLLEWSGKGFAVENALDDLKEMFEQVPANNNSGVSCAIEKIIQA